LWTVSRETPSRLTQITPRLFVKGASKLPFPPADPPLPGRRLVPSLEVVMRDYLAGMTDRYAQQEYRRLFQPNADL
jgi:dGTP triphosphohydrolase